VQGSHAWRAGSAVFDEDNLVSHAGLVPVLELAEQVGLSTLLDEHVRFASERVRSGAANPTPKLTSILAGMAAGADSIDDLDVIRAGGMKQLFGGVYACATLGIFLREFTHGHVRQLAAVLRRLLVALAARTPLLPGISDRCYIDIDSLLRPVYGKAKQGASFGHTKIVTCLHPARPSVDSRISLTLGSDLLAADVHAVVRSSRGERGIDVCRLRGAGGPRRIASVRASVGCDLRRRGDPDTAENGAEAETAAESAAGRRASARWSGR
jgi:hypothetical protein